MKKVAFTLEEYDEIIYFMKSIIGLYKPFYKPGKKKYVVPYNELMLDFLYFKKLSDVGFVSYKVIDDSIYSYSLTKKGADYLSGILGIKIKL